MRAVGKSAIGRRRQNNEDAIFILEGDKVEQLCVVADGMGGHNGGEIASKAAIDAFNEFLETVFQKEPEPENFLDILVEGINFSNQRVYERSFEDKKLAGMGTTFTCALIHNKKLYIGHVGDSRVYIYSEQKGLSQITKDHSYVMEMVKQGRLTLDQARVHPDKNLITRALGTQKKVEVDTVILDITEDDTAILCTDGLYNMLDDKEISKILSEETSLEEKAEKFIELANLKGGTDNISVIIIGQR